VFESVKSRLDREQSLSFPFLEFTYMILQAYGFLEIEPPLMAACLQRRIGFNGQYVNGIDLNPPRA